MVKIINHRLYLSNAPSAQDRGIKCYSKCLGSFLKCFKKVEKFVCEGKTYYVNSNSLKKYSPPRLELFLPAVQNIAAANRSVNSILSLDEFQKAYPNVYCLRTLGPYLNQLAPPVKAQWMEKLSTEPKDFFYEFTSDEEQGVFVKELLNTMTPEEVKAFAMLNPFNFPKDGMGLIHSELFKYLIKHLDPERASYFVRGLWDREGVSDQFRVESLDEIYCALKNDEKPEIYSENLKSCLGSALMWFEENKQWDYFLSTRIECKELSKSTYDAFKALLTMAVILGSRNPSSSDTFLFPLFLYRERYMWKYDLFRGEKNPTLAVELNEEERQKLVKYAQSHSIQYLYEKNPIF